MCLLLVSDYMAIMFLINYFYKFLFGLNRRDNKKNLEIKQQIIPLQHTIAPQIQKSQ